MEEQGLRPGVQDGDGAGPGTQTPLADLVQRLDQ
jgi:hypothetical protein